MTSVLCVTSTFPDQPSDREGNYVYHSMSALARIGVDVTVLVCRPFAPALVRRWTGKHVGVVDAEEFPELATVETVRHASIPRNWLRPVSNAFLDARVNSAARRLIERNRIDLVHVQGEGLAPGASTAAHAAGIPSVVTLHGIDTCPRYMGTEAQRRRFGRALDCMDRVVLVGEPLRAFFAEIARRHDHFRVVPNGFLPPPVSTTVRASRQRFGERVEFISVSNLHEGKGIDINLEALALLADRGADRWRYRVVGDGDQRPALTAMVRSAGLDGRVEFLGALPHSEVYELLPTADAFILPSYREAFGIAYLEAMASGLLVVGVRGQGPEAFVRHGGTGFLVEPKDPAALAKCLEEVLASPERSQGIAEEGQREALANWTWERHAQRLLSLYDEVLWGRAR